MMKRLTIIANGVGDLVNKQEEVRFVTTFRDLIKWGDLYWEVVHFHGAPPSSTVPVWASPPPTPLPAVPVFQGWLA